jgi:hypothetical protein
LFYFAFGYIDPSIRIQKQIATPSVQYNFMYFDHRLIQDFQTPVIFKHRLLEKQIQAIALHLKGEDIKQAWNLGLVKCVIDIGLRGEFETFVLLETDNNGLMSTFSPTYHQPTTSWVVHTHLLSVFGLDHLE